MKEKEKYKYLKVIRVKLNLFWLFIMIWTWVWFIFLKNDFFNVVIVTISILSYGFCFVFGEYEFKQK